MTQILSIIPVLKESDLQRSIQWHTQVLYAESIEPTRQVVKRP